MNIRKIIAAGMLSGLFAAPVLAQDQDQGQVEVLRQSMQNLVNQLLSKGLLSKEDADKLLRGVSSTGNGAASGGVVAAPAAQSGVAATNGASAVAPAEPLAPGVVSVPYIPETVREEIKDQVKTEVLAQARAERWGDPGALPDWLSRISWSGDFRLRGQSDMFPAGNTPTAQYNPSGLTLIPNTQDTHDYMLIMARLGMKAVVDDDTFVAFRITSGNTTNPDSTNQVLGTGYNKSTLVLDRAYISTSPYRWMTFTGGKVPNPWLSTDLVWDTDVDFEGMALNVRPQINENWGSFVTVGAFPYQDVQHSDIVLANSKWLYGAQVGGTWAASNTTNAQFGVALYDFINIEGIPDPAQGSHIYDATAAVTMQKGNTLMYVNAPGDPLLYGFASKFDELDFTGRMDWAAFDPVHVTLTADYVKNLGYNQQEITQRTGVAAPNPQVVAYGTVVSVGMPRIKRYGEWQMSAGYKYIEADAVLDALNDQDFHLGGTNAKGIILRGSYGVGKNTWLSLNYFSSQQISGAPLAIDTLQFDLNARF